MSRKSRPSPTRLTRAALARTAVAAALLLLAAGAGWLVLGAPPKGAPADAALTAMMLAAPALGDPHRVLAGGRAWLNTPPLRPQDLRGKVVVVNFWTYSCINSLRPLPYLRAWAEKYRDRGLVVIGVHASEFAFEKDIGNVRRAVGDQGVGYPVVLDSDHAIWRGFGNNAWPTFYFIGADGRVRSRVVGEGDYEASEKLIQQLLSEAKGPPVTDPIVAVAGVGPQLAPDWDELRSAETYIGYARASGFASPGGLKPDRTALYRAAAQLPQNHWSAAGEWKVGEEFATLAGDVGALAYRFHARDLNLVMAPPPGGQPIRFRVLVDGAAPGRNHGFDTDAEGWGQLDAPRMYQLVRQARPGEDHAFEIQFLGRGARAYVFTFG